jgi:hypothetical protein
MLAREFQSLVPVACLDDLPPAALEKRGKDGAQLRVVIDHENGLDSTLPPSVCLVGISRCDVRAA